MTKKNIKKKCSENMNVNSRAQNAFSFFLGLIRFFNLSKHIKIKQNMKIMPIIRIKSRRFNTNNDKIIYFYQFSFKFI